MRHYTEGAGEEQRSAAYAGTDAALSTVTPGSTGSAIKGDQHHLGLGAGNHGHKLRPHHAHRPFGIGGPNELAGDLDWAVSRFNEHDWDDQHPRIMDNIKLPCDDHGDPDQSSIEQRILSSVQSGETMNGSLKLNTILTGLTTALVGLLSFLGVYMWNNVHATHDAVLHIQDTMVTRGEYFELKTKVTELQQRQDDLSLQIRAIRNANKPPAHNP
jgi:hypothetical protein